MAGQVAGEIVIKANWAAVGDKKKAKQALDFDQ